MARLIRAIGLLALLLGLMGPAAMRASAQHSDPNTGSARTTPTSASGGSTADAGSYTSPTYGYSITYDDSWSVANQESQGGYDAIELDSPNSTFYLEGYAQYNGDPTTCLDSQVSSVENDASVSKFDYVNDENGDPTKAESDTQAYALMQITLTTDDGTTGDLVVYVECRPLVPNIAVLVISFYTTPDVYKSELDRMNDIVDTITLGSGSNGDSDTKDTNVGDGSSHNGGADAQQQVVDSVEATEQDVDDYWTAMFDANDWGDYTAPSFVNFTSDINTGCGAVSPQQAGPFYCPLDDTVYVDVEWMTTDLAPYGDFVIKFAIAHEVGHHVQDLLGIDKCDVTQCLNGYTSLQIELMADCFGGSWASEAHERGLIANGDVENAIVALSEFLGDPANTDSTDPSAHGPGSLRTWWFLRGYYEGPSACFAGADE